jgi:hypothetical protein
VTPPAAGAVAPAAFTAFLAGAPIQRLKSVRTKGLTITCQASTAGRCSVEAKLAAADARRLGLAKKKVSKPVLVGRGSATVAGARPAKVAVRLSAAAARALARARSVRVLVSGTASDAGGHRSALTRVVLVRR